MIKYRNKTRSRLPLLLVGLMTFGLAMIITTADLYGMNYFNSTKPASVNSNNQTNSSTSPYADYKTANISADNDYLYQRPPSCYDNPGAIPEPTTMVLLGLGLGALVVRKKTL